MIGLDKRDSEQAYDEGILETGRRRPSYSFRDHPENPFLPDQEGAGGKILVKDAFDYNKPNQRTDLLLTFTYGQPTKYYQILFKEVLMTNRGPLFFERRSGSEKWSAPSGLANPPFPSPSDSQQLTVFIAGDPNQFSPLVPFPEDSVFLTVEPASLFRILFGYQNLSSVFLALKARLGSR